MPSLPPLPPDRPDLAERYGVSSRTWRTRLPLVVVAVVIVGLVAATLVGLSQRSTGIQAGVLTYGDITESSITITVEVRRDPSQPVVCDVAAVGANQIDVGAERIEVPTGGDRRVVVATVIETASPPLAARLLACLPAPDPDA